MLFTLLRSPIRLGVLGAVAVIMLLPACAGPSLPSVAANTPGLVRTLTGHPLWVDSVAWSPDGKYLASVSTDGTALVWDATTGQIISRLESIKGIARRVAWSPDGRYLATGSGQSTDRVRIWDVTTWQVVQTWNPRLLVEGLTWAPDAHRLAVGTDNAGDPNGAPPESAIEIYAVGTGQITALLTYTQGLGGLAWSPDGKSVAFGSGVAIPPRPPDFLPVAGRVFIWQLARGDGPRTDQNTITLVGSNLAADTLAWSPNSQFLATNGRDNTVQIWDVPRQQVTMTLPGHTGRVTAVAWSSNGAWIASASEDHTAQVWDAAQGQNLGKFQHGDHVNAVAWSPDSKLLATACSDHNVYIWAVK